VAVETIAPQGGLIVQADEFRLWQVAENLIGNSIKFSPEGSKIKIEIAETGPGELNMPSYAGASRLNSKNFIMVSVTDSGEGVPAEDLPKIFDKFYQAKNTAGQSKSTGTGLGLSIVKNIIEAHDGAVWAESDGAGKGTSVKFVLPVGENPATTKI
jgi:two-component system sensor histidine kinase ResE